MADHKPPDQLTNITLIGAGTIGLSFAALHLTTNPTANITIHDPRPDLQSYIATHLPHYLPPETPSQPHSTLLARLTTAPDLTQAVRTADIIQESGPEDLPFKQHLWATIAPLAPAHALFWSSTSGIPASQQGAALAPAAQERLLVVHPFNPPHIMPLLELVPSGRTSAASVAATERYWRARGREPVVLQQECTGFVANRLAFALWREACSLVAQGVVSVAELDAVVMGSMGPRWAVAGPFKAYHAGGGAGGLAAFLRKIGGTVQGCWDASEADVAREGIRVDGEGGGGGWLDRVCEETEKVYGVVDTAERDRRTMGVLEAARGGSERG